MSKGKRLGTGAPPTLAEFLTALKTLPYGLDEDGQPTGSNRERDAEIYINMTPRSRKRAVSDLGYLWLTAVNVDEQGDLILTVEDAHTAMDS